MAVLLITLACSDAASSVSGQRVAVTGLESGRLALVDLAERKVVARLGLPLSGQGVPGVSSDRTLVYYGGIDGGVNTLVEVDIEAATTRRSWKLRGTGYALPGDTSQVFLRLAPKLTVPVNGGTEFLLWPAERNKVLGMARYRPADDTVLAFRRMSALNGGAVTLSERSGWPAGTIVICAAVATASEGLLLLTPDLSTVDSIPLPSLVLPPLQVIIDRDERYAYVRTVPFIFKVELATRRVVAQVQTPSWGLLGLSPDGTTIYEADPGRQLDAPGAGRVALFSSSLQPLGTVDLNPLMPQPTTWMTVGINDSLALVSAGTPPGTLGQRPQPASLFVIDIRRRVVLDRILLGEYGTGMLVMVP